MGDFRAERIGLTNAARLLGVPVSELKAAIHNGETLRGVTPPAPLIRAGENRGNFIFTAGDVMDCAAAIAEKGESRAR